MPPNNLVTDLKLGDAQVGKSSPIPYVRELKYGNIVKIFLIHVAALYGLWLSPQLSWMTISYLTFLGIVTALGTTAGSHRLWTHRSYKAKLPLRLLLAMFSTMGVQNDIYDWVRDHRVHHKYSDTDADPHNITRGFFFAHCGWLMCKKHPEVTEKGKSIDLSDLLSDPVVYYQRKYYMPLAIFFGFVVPVFVPCYFWNEAFAPAFFANMFRYILILNGTWSVNSAAHMFGYKPYDVNIPPAENLWVSFAAMGEGFHNYHHTFPWDYSTSEWRWSLNFTTLFIDAMAAIGQAYDRKFVSEKHLKNRIARTGPHKH